MPAIKIGIIDAAAFEALIDQFEPFAQARTTAQDDFDETVRTTKTRKGKRWLDEANEVLKIRRGSEDVIKEPK